MTNLKPKIDINKTIGENFYLTNVYPKFEYKDGIRTGNVVASNCEICLFDRKLDKITVAVNEPIDEIREILKQNENGTKISFNSLKAKLWVKEGQYPTISISFKADKILEVK